MISKTFTIREREMMMMAMGHGRAKRSTLNRRMSNNINDCKEKEVHGQDEFLNSKSSKSDLIVAGKKKTVKTFLMLYGCCACIIDAQ